MVPLKSLHQVKCHTSKKQHNINGSQYCPLCSGYVSNLLHAATRVRKLRGNILVTTAIEPQASLFLDPQHMSKQLFNPQMQQIKKEEKKENFKYWTEKDVQLSFSLNVDNRELELDSLAPVSNYHLKCLAFGKTMTRRSEYLLRMIKLFRHPLPSFLLQRLLLCMA